MTADMEHARTYWRTALLGALTACLMITVVAAHPAKAINGLPTPDPKPGSFGLEATKKKAPPTTGATITTPGNGASFATSPITVSGICPADLLVQVYDNGVMVGSTVCKGGSFSVQVSLFAGTNELTAIVYDEIDQAGPTSGIVTVNYTDTSFTAFGSLITLTTSYGRRSAGVNAQLTWPLQLSGGTGPYAFSIDWGDGSAAELKSQSLSGIVNIAHVFKKAGIYQVNIKVTDVNGVTAFLQVIAVANGQVDESATTGSSSGASGGGTTTPKILWIPAAVSLFLLFPSYWLGRRSQLVSLHRKMLKEQNSIKQT